MDATEQAVTNHPPCTECFGGGQVPDGNPNDPSTKLVRCDECLGCGSSDPEQICRAAENLERPCPLRVSECPRCSADARAAGIPASVIAGTTKLSDHFTREYIEAQCDYCDQVATRDVGESDIACDEHAAK